MNRKRVRKLLNHGMVCIGMIAEAKSKCLLLKKKLNAAKKRGEDNDVFFDEIEATIVQMRQDLAKYPRRLKKIYKELDEEGVLP